MQPKVGDIAQSLETLAPPAHQEAYDNVGLLVGDAEWPLRGVLSCLDLTEAILEEAEEKDCNLIVAHHPVIFKGLKRLTGGSLQQRLILRAIRSSVALYALHTNLDNVTGGVSGHAAELLRLQDCRVLRPRHHTLSKLETLLPKEAYEPVRKALHAAGAGAIGDYSECSFRSQGVGTFLPNEAATPYIGTSGRLEEVEELRLEVILPTHKESAVCAALLEAHPYQQVAYYVTRLVNTDPQVGSGVVGQLPSPHSVEDFLQLLQRTFGAQLIRHTAYDRPIERVAFCGGSGGAMLQDAVQARAEAFVSADMRYHDFFDTPSEIMCCDIGHAESEAHVKDLICKVLQKKFPNIAVHSTKLSTNPVHYFTAHGK